MQVLRVKSGGSNNVDDSDCAIDGVCEEWTLMRHTSKKNFVHEPHARQNLAHVSVTTYGVLSLRLFANAR